MSGVLDRGKGTQSSDAVVGAPRNGRPSTAFSRPPGVPRGGALVLAGPPGIGKSTLVQYAIDAAPGFRVLQHRRGGVGDGFGIRRRPSAGAPILDGLRRLPEPQREALDAVFGRTQHGPIDPFLVGLAVLSLVADAAGAQPVLVVIDDAQWLDDESALALSFVGRRLWAERLAMVVALRDTPNTSGSLRTSPPARPCRARRPEALDCWRVSVRPLTRPSPPTSWLPRATPWPSSSCLPR